MSTPKYTFFNWDLANSGTPQLLKIKGKKPKKNDVTLNIQLDQALVAANTSVVSNAFIAFATFSTSSVGNTTPYTITAAGGKQLVLEKGFERLTVTVGDQIFTSYSEWQAFVTPATFATTIQPATNVEGSFFTVTVTTTGVADGTVIPFTVAGSDAVVTTSGTVVINGGTGVATLATTSDADNVNDVATLSLLGIATGKPGSTASFTITEPAPAPGSVLTLGTDSVTASNADVFTIYGNELTLGQNDQLVGTPAGTAVLNIGTEGGFDIANFTSTNVDTFEFRPAADLGALGSIDMQAAFGVTNIVVDQSSLAEFYFDDIQSAAGLSATLTDSFSDFAFNFDASALLGSSDSFLVSFAEAPIDALTGEALGIVVTEGPTDVQADLEVLSLESTGPVTNILDRLAVGEALETLNIFGSADLEVLPDIGFLGQGNSQISLIDASGLAADLNNGPSNAFFTYTSELSGAGVGFEVSVLGASGVNRLDLRTAPLDQFATDFRVITQGSADQIFTSGGDDSILSAGGNDIVNAGGGNNTVRSGLGSDFVVAFAGNDVVEADDGNNTVDAGNGNNSVTALGGNDSIRTGTGTDFISAGDGTNTVSAGGGNDSVITGIGNDLVFADDEGVFVDDELVGITDGNDTVRTGAGADTVYAGSGSNIIDTGTENDFVAVGPYDFGFGPGPAGLKLGADTSANTVSLGEGNDILAIDTDSLTISDSINGGDGLDTIQLYNGGVLSQSETLRVSRIETLELVGPFAYDITLSDQLVRTSDEFGSRVFNVAATGVAGDVTLDLSFLTPVDAVGELLSIRFIGQDDDDRETVIIRDGLISDQTFLAFGEDANDADTMRILDSVDVTKDDLTKDNVARVSGLEVIELASTVNGPQTFTFDWRNMSEVEFNTLVGGSDSLIIRATPLLGNSSASTLNLDLTGATFDTSRITIEQSAFLNVNVVGGTPVIETALFFTPNADRIPSGAVIPGVAPFIPDGATVLAYALSDLQDADFVNANEVAANETIEFRFAPSSSVDSLFEQLNFIDVYGIDIFRFVPAAVNQAVSFDSISNGDPGAFEGLDSVITSGGNDYLVNIERSLYVETRGGNDSVTFELFAGPATVVSGDGDDSVLTTSFSDVVRLGSGNNTAFTYAGIDIIDAEDGNDYIFSGENDDTVNAGEGNNFVDGFTGADSIIAGAGNDTVQSGDGNDTVNAGDGNNSVFTGFGLDLVITGSGADFINTANDLELENDSVTSGAGSDSIFVGLGNDSVVAGAGDDFIILDSLGSYDDAEFEVEYGPGGLSAGDSINGGDGTDTLFFAFDVDTFVAPNVPGQFGLSSVENLIVSGFTGSTTITLTREVAIQAGGTINVVLTDGDAGAGDLLLDASAFTAGERLVAGLTDAEGDSSIQGGAGNDQLFTIGAPGSPSTFPFVNSEVEGSYWYIGLGGADTINLLDDDSEFVGYLTVNDGGNAGNGSSSAADLITGFRQTRDSVPLFTNIEDQVAIAGSLRNDVLEAGNILLDGTNLEFVFNGAVDFNGDALIDPSRDTGLVIGNGVSDDLLSDTAGIASRINGFGLSSAVGKGGLVVVQGVTSSALYAFVENGLATDNASADELYKLGTFAGQSYLGGIDTTGNLITTVNTTYDSANFVFA